MTSQNHRAIVLCYVKLWALFQSHQRIQTGVRVRKCSIRFKIRRFFVPCELGIWRMTLKNNRALLLCYLSFVYHFIAISQFKPELQSGNAQFGSKWTIFLSRATLKFDRWHWKTIGHPFYATSSIVHHFIAICEFKLELQSGTSNLVKNRRFLVPCDLEIWRMTLKNDRASLLFHCKRCASFLIHGRIQTGVSLETPKLRQNSFWPLWPWPFVNCDNSWKFPNDTMTETWWKGCDRQTDGQTDGRTEVFSKQ